MKNCASAYEYFYRAMAVYAKLETKQPQLEAVATNGVGMVLATGYLDHHDNLHYAADKFMDAAATQGNDPELAVTVRINLAHTLMRANTSAPYARKALRLYKYAMSRASVVSPARQLELHVCCAIALARCNDVEAACAEMRAAYMKNNRSIAVSFNYALLLDLESEQAMKQEV